MPSTAKASSNAGEFECAKDLSDRIKRAAQTHYGTAGPAFVEAIVAEDIDGVAERIRTDIETFRKHVLQGQPDGQVQRAADRFGLVAAAGELAIALEIVPWPPAHVKWAAEKCFQDWLAARGGAEPYEVQSAIAQVRAFIEAHGDARFERLADGHTQEDRPVVNRAGYRRGSGIDEQWLVTPEAWKRELAFGFDPIDVARWLADRGMLLRAKDGFQTVVKINGRSQRFYVLTAALLAAPECGEDVQ